MAIEITQKARIILDWLKDPITKRYINLLLESESELAKFALIAMNDAISNGLINRSENEIKTFSDLKATRILLSNLPYKILLKYEENQDLNKEDIKDLEDFFDQLSN